MRTLDKNKRKLFVTNLIGITDQLDKHGFKTGVKTPTYSTPIEFKMTLYPNDGSIKLQSFGKEESFDMMGVSSTNILKKDDKIYESIPIEDADHYYIVKKINESINGTQYLLDRMV